MMGEESVAQVVLGNIICAFWMSLLIHKKPYKAGWDNIIAVILAAHLLLTLVSGMALKLYDATPDQDEYQKAGFGAVLITVSVLCVVLGLGSIVVSTPCLRERVMKCLKRGQRKERVHAEKVKVVVDGDIEMTRKADGRHHVGFGASNGIGDGGGEKKAEHGGHCLGSESRKSVIHGCC